MSQLFWGKNTDEHYFDLRQSNMAMDNPLFIDYFPSFKRPPIPTSIYRGFHIQNSIYRNVPIKQHPFIEIVPLKPPCLRHFPNHFPTMPESLRPRNNVEELLRAAFGFGNSVEWWHQA